MNGVAATNLPGQGSFIAFPGAGGGSVGSADRSKAGDGLFLAIWLGS
jgi:hypothetical protein